MIRPKTRPKGQEEALADLASQLGEHFQDFLVMVRTPTRLMWRASEGSWATGAAQRYWQGTPDGFYFGRKGYYEEGKD